MSEEKINNSELPEIPEADDQEMEPTTSFLKDNSAADQESGISTSTKTKVRSSSKRAGRKMPKARAIKFSVLVFTLQVVMIILMGVFGKYDDNRVGLGERLAVYPNLQDVNVMIIFGLGFLLTFLKAYGFSSASFNFLIAVVTLQWAAIVIGFVHTDILGGDKFVYGINRMTESSFATATILISFCVVLGKTSPTQMIVMAIFEVIFAQLNKYIGHDQFKAVDVGESMYLHMFGAYFGMGVARALYNPAATKSEKEGSVYNSDLFAMAGTLFLWLYWPSFNGGFAGAQSEYAISNTFLSLCACAVMVFAISILTDENGKFDMVHIQNATLAGGVGIGACANMPMGPFAAMIIGSVAGIVSTLGFKYLTAILTSKLNLHDTCGVHNLHGIPGWISAIAAAILAATASDGDKYAQDWVDIFPEIELDSSNNFMGRSTSMQAGYQIAAAVVTMVLAFVTGILTGLVLKLPIFDGPSDEMLFDDRDHWNIPEGGLPIEPEEDKNHTTQM